MKADMEGGGEANVITKCDFVLKSKCAKLVWWPGCARTRKGILSIPIDSQTQWLIREGTIPLTYSRSYVRFAVGEVRRKRTDRNGKGNWKEG